MIKILFLMVTLLLLSCSINQERNDRKHSNIIKVIGNDDYESESIVNIYDNITYDEVEIDYTHEIEEVKNVKLTQISPLEEFSKVQQTYSTYKIKTGETLMSVSFKLYGNFHKWKEIGLLNQDLLNKGFLRTGSTIKYVKPEFEPQFPKGKIYIIRSGDYLAKISQLIYNNRSRLWPYIWENNKKQFPSSNIIYSGLPLYYLPLNNSILVKYRYKPVSKRKIASEL